MMKNPSNAKMASPAMKIDTISLALMLRPISPSHKDSALMRSGWSVSSMDRHRNFSANALWFANRRHVRLLLGEDGQEPGGNSKDGKAKRDEHGRDHDFRPLRRIACADCGLYAGDGDVEAVGDEPQQREHSDQVESMGAV